MKQDRTRLLVAETSSGEPVGMLTVRVLESSNITPSRLGRIDDAWVEPDHRRRGVMRRLIQSALDFIESHDARHVMLDYSIQNTISAEAWGKLGFRPALVIAQATVKQVRQATRIRE